MWPTTLQLRHVGGGRDSLFGPYDPRVDELPRELLPWYFGRLRNPDGCPPFPTFSHFGADCVLTFVSGCSWTGAATAAALGPFFGVSTSPTSRSASFFADAADFVASLTAPSQSSWSMSTLLTMSCFQAAGSPPRKRPFTCPGGGTMSLLTYLRTSPSLPRKVSVYALRPCGVSSVHRTANHASYAAFGSAARSYIAIASSDSFCQVSVSPFSSISSNLREIHKRASPPVIVKAVCTPSSS